MSTVMKVKRVFALLGIGIGIGGFGIAGFWLYLRAQWVPPKPAAPASVAAVSTTYQAALSVTTEAQVAELEKQLKEIGFEVCCFKCGPNWGGHSLVGRYEKVDFRIMVNHGRSGPDMPSVFSVYLNADGPSLKEAEAASRRLLALLDNKNGEQTPPAAKSHL
jgi:hypothetical protein